MGEGAAAAAVFLGNAGAQQPDLAGAAPHVAVDIALLGPAGLVGRQFALDEAAHGFLEHPQVFGHPGGLAYGERRVLLVGSHLVCGYKGKREGKEAGDAVRLAPAYLYK